VANSQQNDITAMLAAWAEGDKDALDRLTSRLYPEFRRIARKYLTRRTGDSLESAALANEVYLKLTSAGTIRCEDRTHFLALCAQMIRHILVDHARRRKSTKRGGDALRVPLDEVLLEAETGGIDVIALDSALHSLAEMDGRKSRVVELRYFGGLSVVETAQILEVSVETAKRDWKMARAWLYNELAGRQQPIKT
jgi:RNA polymerase sigma factor (TIGR02999 family)